MVTSVRCRRTWLLAGQGALLRYLSYELWTLKTNGHGQPWDNEPAEIVEICIIDSTGAPLLNTLVKLSGTIHPEAAAKSGINHDLLQDAKPFSELAHQIAQLLYGKAVVIYNAEFDDSLLQEEFMRCGQPSPSYEVRCAMLAYHTFRQRGSARWMRLERACKAEGIAVVDTHRAIGDCLATLALMRRMASQAPV